MMKYAKDQLRFLKANRDRSMKNIGQKNFAEVAMGKLAYAGYGGPQSMDA
jgi:hypothetical protein